MAKKPFKLPKGTVVPDHIAVILDGNGRWARSRGLAVTEGHEAGAKAMREVLKAARQLGVHTLTVWGFSTENWKRPPMEVRKIMALVKRALEEDLETAHTERVRIVHLGRKDRLPKALLELIARAEEETKDYRKHILNLALDYGGRDEILRAAKRIVSDKIAENKIDEELFASYLDTHDQPYPNPDLFIRTSGELRTSGFLPWQMAYTEFYFEEDHLPDMTPEKLKTAILDYSRRRRRFGGKDKASHFKFKPALVASLELNWWRLAKIPEGTSFVDYAAEHVREQWGVSKELALEAAKLMLEATLEREHSKWGKAAYTMGKFYALIKEEVKLAFEPRLAAKLEIKVWQEAKKLGSGREDELEKSIRKQISEVYRISDFQAAKAAHLRALATNERELATLKSSELHWARAEDYLEKYYEALKDRVA